MNKKKIFCWLWDLQWDPVRDPYYPSSETYRDEYVYYDLISKKYNYHNE